MGSNFLLPISMTTLRDFPLSLKNQNADCERGWGSYRVEGAVRSVEDLAKIVRWLEEQWGPSGNVNFPYWRYSLTEEAVIKHEVTKEGFTEVISDRGWPSLSLYMRDEVRVSLLLVLDQF